MAVRSALVSLGWLHIDQFPDMAIEILKAMAIHESLVLRFSRRTSAACDSLFNQLINLCAALARKADKNLRVFLCIADRLVRERCEETLSQQHGKDVVTENHTRRLIIGKLRL